LANETYLARHATHSPLGGLLLLTVVAVTGSL
jgi:hypothetical protein